jgi:hypothetical protein
MCSIGVKNEIRLLPAKQWDELLAHSSARITELKGTECEGKQ